MTIGYICDDGDCLDLALHAGAEAAICKPFSIDQLSRAIRAVLNPSRAPANDADDVPQASAVRDCGNQGGRP